MALIYLDHAATTPLDPRVFEAMVPYLKEQFGNASSVHALGRKARFAVEDSRERIAGHLGAEPGEIVFTSGATESNNAALHGVLAARPGQRLVTSAAEHESVLQPAEALARKGHPVTMLSPAGEGSVSPGQIEAELDKTADRASAVALVSIMHANNEVGTISRVRGIAALCRVQNVLVHCDAVQSMGLFPLTVNDLGVDLLSLSGHKFYGPKGVGVLYVRGGVDLHPLVLGGAQERKRRGGTENVASLVGLARALDLAREEGDERRARLAGLHRLFRASLAEALEGPVVFNSPDPETPETARGVPHILNLSFPPEGDRAVDGEMLLFNLDVQGICASSGSACTSGAIEPSHVLLAMGRDRATASATVRFSMGKDTTESDLEQAVDRLAGIVRRLRH